MIRVVAGTASMYTTKRGHLDDAEAQAEDDDTEDA
jgi:hypothetical protein